jgi:uncharacterized surface protein with fasciclin (FAS1) repeats
MKQSLSSDDFVLDSINHLPTYQGEDVEIRRAIDGQIQLFSKPGKNATVLGYAKSGTIGAFFIDGLLSPPIKLAKQLIESNYTAAISVFNATNTTALKLEEDPYTFLLPSESALSNFVNVTCGTISKFNETYLQSLLGYHLSTQGKIYSENALSFNMTSLNMTNGEFLVGNYTNKTVTFYGARNTSANVTTADLMVSNGVVHIIDSVLLPLNITDPCVTN